MSKKKTVTEENLEWGKMAASMGAKLLDDLEPVKCYIDTGNLALNFVCSGKFVGGGMPSGRIIEIFGDSSSGKSLVGTNVLKGTQMCNGVPIMLDAEYAMSKEFAVRASKIDPKRLIVVEADTLEQGFSKINNAIRTVRQEWKVPIDKPIMIIYDSIAASPSEREFAETTLDLETATKTELKEAGAGTDKPGERAKTCSKELRKLPKILDANNASVIFINQIRQKIGVMFGCFSYNSMVMLADGSFEKIGKIVNNRLPLDVMSVDLATGKVEPKPIVDWHANGKLATGESFMKVKFKRHFGHTNGHFICTKNHKIIRKTGEQLLEIAASELKIGDELCVVQPCYLSQDQWQIVYGSIMGDGSLRKREYGTHSLRITHGIKQKEYCLWKQSLLGNIISSTESKHPNRYGFETNQLYELNEVGDYKVGKKEDRRYSIPDLIKNNMNELGLAIWYLDDGTYSGHHDKWGRGKSSICCKKFPDKEAMLPFFHKYGLHPSIKPVGFVFDADDTDRLHSLICRFVPDCMAYKLHEKYRYLGGDFNFEKLDKPYYVNVPGKVLEIHDTYKSTLGTRCKFDLTIADNATYVVGGAVVHNSDETTAGGGRALEYYASLRLKMRSNKVPKDKKGNVIGVNVSVTNVKNKCYKPFVEANKLYLFFDQGINPFGGLLQLLIQNDRISGGGGNYTVHPDYSGGKVVKFKSSLDRNDVPIETLLECPKLVDAETPEQVQYYVDLYKTAIDTVDDGIAEEEDVQEMIDEM